MADALFLSGSAIKTAGFHGLPFKNLLLAFHA
jgi:hypothetical protein